MALLYEPGAQPRVVLSFQAPNDVPLTVTIQALREATWGLSRAPKLRLAWRFASLVKLVTFSAVKSFVPGDSTETVRVEVAMEGAPALAFEGQGMMIGPLAGPFPNVPPPPAANERIQWS